MRRGFGKDHQPYLLTGIRGGVTKGVSERTKTLRRIVCEQELSVCVGNSLCDIVSHSCYRHIRYNIVLSPLV